MADIWDTADWVFVSFVAVMFAMAALIIIGLMIHQYRTYGL